VVSLNLAHPVESLRRHCTITGVRNVKQVSFKPGPEDCYGRCGSDNICIFPRLGKLGHRQ